MITVKITRTTSTPYEETVNYIVKETPTAITADTTDYNGRRKLEVQTSREYAPSVVKQIRPETVTLIEQNIEAEESFDLAVVLRAINNL
jgi:hypothetical protein